MPIYRGGATEGSSCKEVQVTFIASSKGFPSTFGPNETGRTLQTPAERALRNPDSLQFDLKGIFFFKKKCSPHNIGRNFSVQTNKLISTPTSPCSFHNSHLPLCVWFLGAAIIIPQLSATSLEIRKRQSQTCQDPNVEQNVQQRATLRDTDPLFMQEMNCCGIPSQSANKSNCTLINLNSSVNHFQQKCERYLSAERRINFDTKRNTILPWCKLKYYTQTNH